MYGNECPEILELVQPLGRVVRYNKGVRMQQYRLLALIPLNFRVLFGSYRQFLDWVERIGVPCIAPSDTDALAALLVGPGEANDQHVLERASKQIESPHTPRTPMSLATRQWEQHLANQSDKWVKGIQRLQQQGWPKGWPRQ